MLRSNFSIFKISHTNTLYDESWILYEFPSWKYVTIKLRKLVHYGYKGGRRVCYCYFSEYCTSSEACAIRSLPSRTEIKHLSIQLWDRIPS